jgi:hypothetical protein
LKEKTKSKKRALLIIAGIIILVPIFWGFGRRGE